MHLSLGLSIICGVFKGGSPDLVTFYLWLIGDKSFLVNRCGQLLGKIKKYWNVYYEKDNFPRNLGAKMTGS
jgi:hypothetical protein